MNRVPSGWLEVAAVGCCALFSAVVAYRGQTNRDAWLYRIGVRYHASLRAKLGGAQAGRRATRLLVAQLAAMALVAAATLGADLPGPELCLAAIVWVPHGLLSRAHARRQRALRAQLPGFLTALAGAVRVSGSPVAALANLPCMTDPLREHVHSVNQAVRLGTSLDDALGDLAARTALPAFSVAISALLIARRCGGDLPRVLESAAAGLREDARLEGVMTARTSEARAQLAVLVVCPFAIIALIGGLSPSYFEPLQGSLLGWVVVVGAGVLWLGALLVARAVLVVKE